MYLCNSGDYRCPAIRLQDIIFCDDTFRKGTRKMKARDLMTTKIYHGDPDDTLRNIYGKMLVHDCRHLPIVSDQGELIGIVSDRDVRDQLTSETAVGYDYLSEEAIMNTPVLDIMSTKLITVTPDTHLIQIIDLILEHGIGAVPVVREGSRKIEGMISYIDILRETKRLIPQE